MTCIVGISYEDKVLLGSDCIGSDMRIYQLREEPKVFKNGAFVMGYTSSFRFGQLLQYAFTPPEQLPSQSDHKYLCTTFVDAIRNTLKKGGYAKEKDSVECAGTALIGYKGNLYALEDDYQIALASGGVGAVGHGDSIALGSLYSTKDKKPQERLQIALEAAEYHDPYVKSPFSFIEL